ncbi:MAG: tetratricopeptide repeat protein [Burkholderiales bacterium]|nr:tetratricopeptide repeat protein [Burkholderiales bacterium]
MRTHFIPSLLAASVLLCASLAPPRALANPALLRDAQQLLAANNPKQAYMILFAQQDQLSGNAEFDYLLGQAALESGKIDEAIIAFERVLQVDPKNAGARIDLARAYFNAGSMDLAQANFIELRASNPPPAALMVIEKYLAAIRERRSQTATIFSAWGETSLGYDSNLTGVPTDFSAAVLSAFNIDGIRATGNSIKRKAPYIGAAVGADYNYALKAGWVAFVGGEARGRAYRKEADFKSISGEARVGTLWADGPKQLRLAGGYSRFNQEGLAPGDPKPTNDRTNAMISADYRYALNDRQQLSVGVAGSRVKFLSNRIEDFDAAMVTAGFVQAFDRKGAPLWQLSGFYSRDEAARKLADGISDKSKRVAGVRSYFQYSLTDNLAWFNGLGFSVRRDESAFARATQVQIGRDRLADATLGVNWRFQQKCSMRAQWFASRNDSNIAIYDFTRHEVSSTIRCDFQ